jgi:dinuclear metal center YbgI/SA1388 family protein
MKIREIIQHLEYYAPLEFQEEYDNSGLISGNADSECTGILINLDCTENVVYEAVRKKCNLIISHHPLIFRPIRNLVVENEPAKTLVAAIKADVAVYAIHTNLDNIISGVNATIADKLGLLNRRVLLPRNNTQASGSGLVGDLEIPLSEKELLERLKKAFGTPVIRHSPLFGKLVSRVAVCGGAGSFLISNALREKAGFFISADIKYHEFFENRGELVIADIGHFESEQFTVELLVAVILEKYPNFAVLKSGTVTNPVNYYI